MSPRLLDLVLGALVNWWRQQWHNVLAGLGFLIILIVLCVLLDPLGGGL